MKEIQLWLRANERVEVYYSHITYYNLNTNEEIEFEDEFQLINYLKTH